MKNIQKANAKEYINGAEHWLARIYRWLGLAIEIIRFGKGKLNEKKSDNIQ